MDTVNLKQLNLLLKDRGYVMNYLAKNQRYTLLKLNNNFENLEDVRNKVLVRDYKEPLTVKNIPVGTPDDELHFLYQWTNTSDNYEINFDDFDVGFEYVKANSQCEFSTRRILDQSTGILLPKEERLNTSNVDVIFVKSGNDIFAVAFSSEFYDLRRIKRLIGEVNLEPLPAQHQTDSDLFNWLFYKRIREELTLSDNITLDNINGFTGNVLNEDNQFEGTSLQTAELIITKAFITNGYPITSIKIDLQMSIAAVNFYLNKIPADGKELSIVIQKNSSISPMMNNEETEYVIPIYVFFCLIPSMIDLYKEEESEFLSKERNSFLAEIGIEVIKTIISRNNIDIEDIK